MTHDRRAPVIASLPVIFTESAVPAALAISVTCLCMCAIWSGDRSEGNSNEIVRFGDLRGKLPAPWGRCQEGLTGDPRDAILAAAGDVSGLC